jgi:hypothetical protein
VIGQRAGVVAHVLARGERVEVATERFQALGDRARVAALGALEHHVLDEVGDPEALERLVPRPGAHPHAQGHGLAPGHALGEERDPGRQHGLAGSVNRPRFVRSD